MREAARHCATCGEVTMHRRSWFARLVRRATGGWSCERCDWKRTLEARGGAVEFGSLLGFNYAVRRAARESRFRKPLRTTTFIDPL